MTDYERADHDGQDVGPPEPVATNSVCGDEACDRERRVRGEGGGDDRSTGEPPRQLSVGGEERLCARTGAAGMPCPPAEGDREIGEDDAEIDRVQDNILARPDPEKAGLSLG